MRRVRRTTGLIEYWIGALHEDRRQRVAQLRGDFPETTEDWLSYNVGKQQRLLGLLREGADALTLEDFLIRWWGRLEGRSSELKREHEQALAALKRLIVAADESLDTTQRRFLVWRLDAYIEQIEGLMAQQ